MAVHDSRAPKDALTEALGKLVSVDAVEPVSSLKFGVPYDVKEDRHELTILIDLPGVDEDEIIIHEEDANLRIAARREFDHDLEDAEEYTHIARPYGTLTCTVPIPP